MSYTHITPINRNELAILLRTQIKQKEIARLLNKHRTSIWREKKRNSKEDGMYNARTAKKRTKERRIKANQRFRKIDNNSNLKKIIIKHLKIYLSPEEISGRLKNKGARIGKDSIYSFIYEDRQGLVKFLRCQKGKYRRKRGTSIRIKQRKAIEKKKNISLRPSIVETRERIGDWEGDTVWGNNKKGSVLLTHVERKSGLVRIGLMKNKTAGEMKEKTLAMFKTIPKNKKHTVTYDNGSENAEYELIEKEAKIDVYFANAYHSWERGSNENCNGLIRQFFPKGMSFDNITEEQVKKVERLLNNRPRKRLGYLTPNEVFHGSS
ncbi:MAG: transposase, family [Patescibacteria group bacterium]|nr:transposase, family [Patescibacteria group bacterium]